MTEERSRSAGGGGDFVVRRSPLQRLRMRLRERRWERGGKSPPPRSDPGTRGMRLVYAGLLGSAVLATAAALLYPDSAFAERFGPNIATEAMSALVTIAVVRRLLERQERAQRLRGSVGALRRSSRALGAMVDTWASMVKGARAFRPPLPGRADELFAPYITEDLMFIDPAASGGAEPGEGYVAAAARRLRGARRDLQTIIGTYGGDLEAEYKEILDALVDDPFVDLVTALVDREPTLRDWRVSLNTSRGHREAHFTRLLHAVRLHNDLASEAARHRSRAAAPRSDLLGVMRPLDYDTRVDLDLRADWWRRQPTAGSLDARQR